MTTALSPRDLEALTKTARFRMLTRSQLERWVFPGRNDNVAKRCIDRLATAGLLGSERLHLNGVQIVWCTAAGRDFLVESSVARALDLFPGRGPIPAKDFAHTAAIADVAITLDECGRSGDLLLPAWAFQRYFSGRATVIPDLLCLTRPMNGHVGRALAVEVDLGGEPVRTVLATKTQQLAEWLATYGNSAAILILVDGARRLSSVQTAVRNLSPVIPVVATLLSEFRQEAVGRRCMVEPTTEAPETAAVRTV